ncbi:MAG: hypothetical protein HKM89_10065, partial [Gemmatimonadales bacterium]|nr:hypothetical protein [Gemmatimonadales bacterium]
VQNERRSIPLEFEATGRPGVFKVDQTWPAEGNWLVAVSAGDDATMVIELGGNDGGVNRTSYYGQRATELSVRSIRTMNRKPSKRQITQNLKAIASAVE